MSDVSLMDDLTRARAAWDRANKRVAEAEAELERAQTVLGPPTRKSTFWTALARQNDVVARWVEARQDRARAQAELDAAVSLPPGSGCAICNRPECHCWGCPHEHDPSDCASCAARSQTKESQP